MKPLSDEWCQLVGSAIGKSAEEVYVMIGEWWNQGKALAFINNELMRLAEANGKKLVLVNQNNN